MMAGHVHKHVTYRMRNNQNGTCTEYKRCECGDIVTETYDL